MAAFLPPQNLWTWHGSGCKRRTRGQGRATKEFYRAIIRGKEVIEVS